VRLGVLSLGFRFRDEREDGEAGAGSILIRQQPYQAVWSCVHLPCLMFVCLYCLGERERGREGERERGREGERERGRGGEGERGRDGETER